MTCILAIGNSFSQDATYYLHQIAAADGTELKVVNLYIGGCSLERHWENVRKDAADYLYEINGESTQRYVSIRETLSEEKWDYIVTQQASHDSGWADTYEPFLGNLVDWLGECAPQAKLLLQKTWAYEIDSTHEKFPRYHNSQQEMYVRLSRAYDIAAKNHGLALIPCADIIQKLRTLPPFLYEKGGISLCRDGFHMDYLYGRYALAAAWYRALTGNCMEDNSYIPHSAFVPEEKADGHALEVIRTVVDEMTVKIC